jgi:hypothetical protein
MTAALHNGVTGQPSVFVSIDTFSMIQGPCPHPTMPKEFASKLELSMNSLSVTPPDASALLHISSGFGDFGMQLESLTTETHTDTVVHIGESTIGWHPSAIAHVSQTLHGWQSAFSLLSQSLDYPAARYAISTPLQPRTSNLLVHGFKAKTDMFHLECTDQLCFSGELAVKLYEVKVDADGDMLLHMTLGEGSAFRNAHSYELFHLGPGGVMDMKYMLTQNSVEVSISRTHLTFQHSEWMNFQSYLLSESFLYSTSAAWPSTPNSTPKSSTSTPKSSSKASGPLISIEVTESIAMLKHFDDLQAVRAYLHSAKCSNSEPDGWKDQVQA